ncbi:MAG TPA: class I SAM-dependent methyltransferase [Vicinamibacterales bacterium]|nr:class I SAM-dependent methyltransferase [Vicinamibacterales bacterium]
MSTPTPFFRPCWCGNTQLEPFSEHYRACRNCETLVSMFDQGKDVSRVADDDADLYGRDYWFGHMEEDLGFANIHDRARIDLTERCLFWLETLLRFQRPPARILELGSAHGGFVALMRWAGFEARGLELSPEIVALATQLFGVPMWQGPIEDQPITAGSLDLIAAMDVLEHLPDPVATLRHCVSLLAPGGQVLVQTPQYREGATLEQLQAEGHRFVEQLKEREHLYLFSATSVKRLAAVAGVPHVSFEPAVFSHYDMFLIMSAAPIAPLPAEARTPLTESAGARLVQALLDLYGAIAREKVVTATHAADVAFLKRLAEEQQAQRAEEAAQLNAAIADLTARLAHSEQDRADRLAVIEQQGAEIGRAAVLDGVVAELTARLAHSEQDRADRLVVIERQGAELGQLHQRWSDRDSVAKRLAELKRPVVSPAKRRDQHD